MAETIERNMGMIDSDIEEYYNAIRTNIQFFGNDMRTILMTSVTDSEGKSTVSINLATSFAELGKKTLLIDADTRNSVLLNRFNINKKVVGLTNYLSGISKLEEVLYNTNQPNLTILPAGKVPPNPTVLLQNNYFDEMMRKRRREYDYIIVDTPPIGMVIDAAIIGLRCDGAVVVVESGKVGKRAVMKARESLEQAGCSFLGVILNKVGKKGSNYGGYGGYGGYGSYGSYGQYGKKKNKK